MIPSSSTNLHWQINSDVKLFLGLATRSLHSRASIGPELDGVVDGRRQLSKFVLDNHTDPACPNVSIYVSIALE